MENMIIDTKAHIFDRIFDLDDPMQPGWLYRYRWHPHSGQLLKEEMDFACHHRWQPDQQPPPR